VKVVRHLVLILKQPVDRRLVAHRFLDHFGGCLAMNVEEGLVVDFVDLGY
jgi:hypothetical protein